MVLTPEDHHMQELAGKTKSALLYLVGPAGV
jgi:hypothetical protein